MNRTHHYVSTFGGENVAQVLDAPCPRCLDIYTRRQPRLLAHLLLLPFPSETAMSGAQGKGSFVMDFGHPI